MGGMSYAAVLALILQKIGGIPLLGAMRVIAEGSPVAKQSLMSGLVGLVPGASLLSAALGGGGLGAIASNLSSAFTNPIGAITDAVSGVGTGSISSVVDSLASAAGTGLVTYAQITTLTTLLNGRSYSAGDGTYSTVTSNHLANSLPPFTTLTNNMSGVTAPNIGSETANVSVINTINFPQVVSTLSMLHDSKANVSPIIDTTYGVTTKVNNTINTIVEPFSNNTTANLTSMATILSNLEANAVAGHLTSTMIDNAVTALTGHKTLVENLVTSTVSTFTVSQAAMDAANYISSAHSTLSAVSGAGGVTNPAYDFVNKTCASATLTALYPAVPSFISSITPNSGSISGNNNVVIKGGYFLNVQTVQFNSTNAISFSVVDANTIYAVTPSISGTGPAFVIVNTDAGMSGSISGTNIFTYG